MESALDPIVITGVGVLACNGIGREAYWDSLRNGRSGIREVDRFDTSEFPCHIAGQLWDFNPEDFMRKGEVKRWHSHVHQSVSSAQLAVDEAELQNAGYDPDRMAVGFGTSVGPPDEHYLDYREAYEKTGWSSMYKFASSSTSAHAATANVSARFHLRGPATTIGTGCSTGLDVLSWGLHQLRTGSADMAVVGATESPITPLIFAMSAALGILTTHNDEPEKAMRPFDKTSDGLVLSEGAVALVLERASAAEARGARIFGVIAGYGSTGEGNNALLIDKKGVALSRAIETAIADAGMLPQDVDAAFCHEVGLSMYDKCEVNAFKAALGPHAYRIPISATKSMIGQAYAVGGLYSVVGALMTLDTGIVPPTMNLNDPAPDCDLDFVPLEARANDVRAAIVTALSFGGTHTAAIIKRHEASRNGF